MTTLNRTVLVIRTGQGRGNQYEELLRYDPAVYYRVITQQYGVQLPSLSLSHHVDGILLESDNWNGRSLDLLNRFQLNLGDICPPVVVIGRENVHAAVEALKAGAADYLVKDHLTPDSLCVALRTAIENAELKRELKQSQECFQASIDSMMDCFGIFSSIRDASGQIIDFRIDFLNEAACQNNQMPREQHLGRGLCEILPGHRESGLFDEYCHLVETGIPVIKESVIYEDVYGGPHRISRIFDIHAAKHNDGVVASWRDVTHRKQTELALQEKVQEAEASRQTLDALMTYLPEGITIADGPDVTIRQVSRYGQQLLGRPAEMLEGISIDDHAEAWAIFYPDGVTPAKNEALPLTRAVQKGEVSVDEEWVLQRADGTKLVISCNAGPIYDGNGHITGGVIAWRDISHRKRMISELNQTSITLEHERNRLKRLIDHAPIGIGIGTANGDVIHANDEMLRLHGYSREDFDRHGMNWCHHTPPEYADQMADGIDLIRREGFISPTEKELLLQDGTRVPIWISAVRWDDNPDEHVAFAVNLTAYKQAEADLKASEQRLQHVLNSLFSFVGILSPEGIILEINQPALNMASLEPEVVIDLPFEQAYWWAYSLDIQAQLKDALCRAAHGETVRYDVLVRFGPNQLRMIDFALVPLLNADGRVEYLIASGIDVTERVKAEESLRESQTQLQQQLAEIEAIYQTAPIGLNVLDRDLRFVRINEKLAEVNGLSLEAHLGRTVREVLPNLADVAEQLLQTILETGEPLLNVEIEGETPAAPGVKRVWREHFVPLKDGDKVIGISTVCEEITERKQAEAEREQILQREHAAKEEAERANRIKDEFLAILSHELRSPLNPILGWSKLLRTKKMSPEKTARALETIERNAKIQTQLIDDLLDIAKLLRGKLELKTAPLNPAPVIEAAIETVRTLAEAKAIIIHADLPDIGYIQGDSVRLQQIVWNLLTNAVKFTPNHGQVTVRLDQVTHLARITVTDTGVGIHPDFLPHIFESFRQEDTSITRQFGGLGLGLAIVRYLVTAHGGTVTADSPGEGQGATFTVTIPLLRCTSNPKCPERIFQGTIDLTGIRVMAVDDDPDSLELITIVLRQYGAEVRSMMTATGALEAIALFHPDVLVSDIGMPDLDGYELIRNVRSLPPEQGGQVPAIALTAYARDDDSQKALDQGFQAHMAKPIEPERLIQAVAALSKGVSTP